MDNKGKRIIGSAENISYEKVKEFFDNRSQNDSLRHKYNYVMYLDNTPQVAIQRDLECKAVVEELLNIDNGMNVLDIGCGIGRWGELFCKKGLFYTGIDGSAKMIERAEDNLSEFGNKRLIVADAQNIRDALTPLNDSETVYDIVFVCGVLMYLNDADIMTIFETITDVCSENAQLCFVESMSDDERLTLQEIYSEELNQDYSAIYRTVTEFMNMMHSAFDHKFELKYDRVLDFSDGMQKKRKHVTQEHCIIWETK